MLMLYLGLVIMIYAYFNKNIKKLNKIFKIKFKSFQMWSKEFGIDFKRKLYSFQRIIYHTKKRWKESYWMITCKTYILALMKFRFFWKKVLWIIIIIAIEACVVIDTIEKKNDL
jgi:hypothetical protein